MPSLVIFRSCGTDESFRNTCGMDLRFIGTVRLQNFYLVKGYLSPSLKNASFCELVEGSPGISGIVRLPERNTFDIFSKMGF